MLRTAYCVLKISSKELVVSGNKPVAVRAGEEKKEKEGRRPICVYTSLLERRVSVLVARQASLMYTDRTSRLGDQLPATSATGIGAVNRSSRSSNPCRFKLSKMTLPRPRLEVPYIPGHCHAVLVQGPALPQALGNPL